MTPCCDAHLHLQLLSRDRQHTHINTMRDAGISHCVVNGTHPNDWQDVANLAENYPGFIIPSFGLHPWKCANVHPSWQQTLQSLLENFPAAGIGEIGLDRWINHPNITTQQTAFEWQWQLAHQMNRPISIHCLKAWGPLLNCLESLPHPESGFLLHSYGGSAELITQLLPYGAHFSFSGAFLHPRKTKVQEAFKQVPMQRLMVETDAPEMRPPPQWDLFPDEIDNHPANLPAILRGLASILNEPLDKLTNLTTNNFHRFFLHTHSNP